MYIYVDTSDPRIIKDFVDRGMAQGVTTNPKTASDYIKENSRGIKTIRDLAVAIYDVAGPIPVSIETIGCGPPDYRWHDMTDLDWRKWKPIEDRIYAEAVKIIEWNDELGASFWQKVPTIPAGVRATGRLVHDYGEKARINATLGFDYMQAVRAAEAGACVFSLFMGRMEARGENPVEVQERILREYTDRELRTCFLAASMRSPELILKAHRAGAHIATAPPEKIEELARRFPTEFEYMISHHPERGRQLVSMNVPVMYNADEFQHPLLKTGVELFVEPAREANYDLLAEAA